VTTSTATGGRRASHPMKSPLAASRQQVTAPGPVRGAAPGQRRRGPAPRTATLEEFADYLRTITNRDGRPFQPTSMPAGPWTRG
jgi:hypothetical protein